MGVSQERQLLKRIRQNAHINKECSECVHEGDYSFCSECKKMHHLWSWRWEENYKKLTDEVKRRTPCQLRKSQKKKSVIGI